MLDGETKTQEALPEKGQSSEEGKNPSQSYNQEQVDALLRERHSKLDNEVASLKKQIDSIGKERDTFKSQLAEAQSAHAKATELVKDLEKDLETAVAEDADQADILKLKRELRTAVAAERETLGRERKAFEDERKAHNTEWESKAEKIKQAEETEWEMTVFDVAKTVEGDAPTLRTAADELGITSKEALEKLAKRLFPPKPLVDGEPASLDGRGGTDFSHMTPEEKISYGLAHPKKPR